MMDRTQSTCRTREKMTVGIAQWLHTANEAEMLKTKEKEV